MPDVNAVPVTLLIVGRPLCALCIAESGITATDIAAYVKSTASAFALNDEIEHCPRCHRPAKVFSLVPAIGS